MYDVLEFNKKSVSKSQEYLGNILLRNEARDREEIIKFGNMEIIDKILTRAISLEYRE